MKIRIVVMSLIFVVAFMVAACSSDSDLATETRQAKEAPSPTTDQARRTALAQELEQAATLLNQAKSELEQDTEDAQAKAKRTLGHPVFLISDFRDPQGFAERLKTNRPLSEYLFSKFAPITKTSLEKNQDDPVALAGALREELDKQLYSKDLYETSRFPQEKLKPETIDELRRNQSRIKQLRHDELVYLNRLLLQDSYREFISPAPAETVLSHLQKAETLAQKLDASELPPNFQLNLSKTEEDTRALLREQSEDGEDTALSASHLTKVSGNVNDVLKSLEPAGDKTTGTFDSILALLWDALYYLLLIAAAVIPVAVIAFLIKRARDNAAAKKHANLQALNKIIDRYDQLRQEFGSFKNQNTSEIEALKDQLSRLENAYRILARQNTQYTNSSANTHNVNRFYEPPPAPIREEPEFPVSAETYLQRMKGSNRPSTVIRPDFQNGILVKDAEGRGELVLVEDSAGPVDFQRLFVVPSVSQFQMKQDFYNYYDGYYECDQPTAGDVWIVHPAIVEKVNGGWRLMEKGRLEVR